MRQLNIFFYGSSFSFWQISFNASLFAPSIDPVLFFNLSSCTTFLWFIVYVLFYLYYAILFMYLFIFKVLICRYSCFKLVKSCIAPYNAVNSDCIFKGIETLSWCFVYKYRTQNKTLVSVTVNPGQLLIMCR